MADNAQHNKRIAKNTMFLYVRMLFLMFISFFTSRMLLKELGVVDFGIYNVVGSVVAIFGSIQTLLASSTQRFLNNAHGKKDFEKLNKIFSMSIIIHVMISFIFLLIILPIGLYIINSYLSIPVSRLNAANWVYLFSVLSSVILILTVPYNAVILANEKMSFFAYISILDGVLRLIVVFLISFNVFDKLIVYAVLLFVIGLIIRIINIIYCRQAFNECRVITYKWNRPLFNELAGFAGWQFFGNTGSAIQTQGFNMFLNTFFGPILNAAAGITNQVNGALNLFINNLMVAINPQLTKSYASKDYSSYTALFLKASRYSFLIFSILVFPVLLGANALLKLWLVIIPDYTEIFLKWTLLYSLLRSLNTPIDSALKAVGRIKEYQISVFFYFLVSIVFIYITYKNNGNPQDGFIVMIVIQLFSTSTSVYYLRKYSELELKIYLSKVIFPSLVIIVTLVVLHNYLILHSLLEIALGSIIFAIYVSCVLLSRQELVYILDKVKFKFLKK